ncbi:MAG: type II toxin-antitoxin system prevent-host-death family antitoxin [Saprospiraceae bacterium]|nr:type II toxin-antitoxin system prevent-host-death family antitoxin [Pyrinomonadaceae bacterium]
MKISVYEAKSKLSQMINKALEGEEVIITRNGTETVRLVPVPKKKNWVGMYKGQVKIHDSFFEPLDDETLALFYGEEKK